MINSEEPQRGNTGENIAEKRVYNVDVRQKHPNSKEHYRNPDLILREQKNPFLDLEGKEVMHNGQKVAVLHVRVEPFPQCVSKGTGWDCGWYYQITTDIPAHLCNAEEAQKSVLDAVGNGRQIDYVDVAEYS